MMHEDLLAVSRLWANLAATRQLEAEQEGMLSKLEQARTDFALAQTSLDGCTSTQKRRRQEEQAILQKLETYQRRVNQTRTLIDSGKASDYQVAVRQLEACKQICDQLETETLERMEELDDLANQIRSLEQALVKAQESVEDLQRKYDITLPHIHQELSRLRAEEPLLASEIPLGFRLQVAKLISQRRSLVAPMRAGVCGVCNYSAPPQVVHEVNRGIRVHGCRHCGRYLLPEESG